MALDGNFLRALCRELAENLAGAKIEKVNQPSRNEIVLSVKTASGRRELYLGGGNGGARVCFTAMEPDRPAQPPMFCMLLRKHLVGARVLEVSQPGGDRILRLDLDAPGTFGLGERRSLICELFGRSANIILTDGDDIITDCLYRTGGIDEKRAVLPGMRYRPPEMRGKRDLFALGGENIAALLDAADSDMLFDKWILDSFEGVSPLVSRELCLRACGGVSEPVYSVARDRALEALDYLRSASPQPLAAYDEAGQLREFSYIPVFQYGGEPRRAESFSSLLDSFWSERTEEERRRRRTGDILKTVKTLRDRVERRLGNQRRELLETEKREYYRQCGDLITSNLYRLRKGETAFEAEDWFMGGVRQITLDPLKTPQENAARYYKEYSKLKSAESHLMGEIDRGEKELAYLESVLEELGRADSFRAVSEIREELYESGILRREGKKREKIRPEGPLQFTSTEGYAIRVGRNNLQNDELTFRSSAKTDIWLHALKSHGSHVIISCAGTQPGEETIAQAAALAAYYSQAREGSKVPVDWTLVKYVKKPAGARPGMVTYTNQHTVLAEPRGTIE